ncbi:MAG: BON domain-containing protein [Nitrosomonadaceae bacterium]|nr:MAG: BON domain-containing protein [Nitrosomonadaceae bacterium]
MTLRYRLTTPLSVILLVSMLGCVSAPRQGQMDESATLRPNELSQSGASTSKQEHAAGSVDDAVIAAQIKEAILNEPSLRTEKISVETFQGTVQLSGFVSTFFARNKAIEITRSIKGVMAVKDEMRLMGQY